MFDIVGEYMKISLILLSLFLLYACEAPQRGRVPLGHNTNAHTGPHHIDSPWSPFTGPTTGTTSGTGPTTNTNPQGFENCNLDVNQYYASGINYIGVCQSSLDETLVAIKNSQSDSSRTCLIPTFKENSGSSTYIGQPQCFIPEANKVITGKLYKTRPGFTNSPLNGLMVMKEQSMTAYFGCMDAYVTFVHSLCPQGPKTPPYYYQNQLVNCDLMARNMMAEKCNAFKAMHSYIDIKLK
jgi:hypothetical protein